MVFCGPYSCFSSLCGGYDVIPYPYTRKFSDISLDFSHQTLLNGAMRRNGIFNPFLSRIPNTGTLLNTPLPLFHLRLPLKQVSSSSISSLIAIHLYSHRVVLPSEAQILSVSSPARYLCTADARCFRIFFFMNTSLKN